VLGSWYGLFAPAGTPREIIVKLNAEAVKALAAPDLRERFLAIGVDPIGNSPEQFAAEVRDEHRALGQGRRRGRRWRAE